MEWIVNFLNRTVDIGSWLISCIAVYVVMLPAVLMPLIMGQQLLFFNKKSFKVPKSDAFLLDLVAKMSRSAKLKGLNLLYPIAWRDFLLRNTMSTGELRNMMFKISHIWDQKRPTKKSEDRIPSMLLPASPQPAIPRPALKDFWNNRRQESVPFVLKVHPSSPSRLSVHGPLWRTSETIGVGSYAIRFKSPSQRPVTDVRPRPAITARSDGLLKQSAWEAMPFVSKVHPSGPSRTSVHGPPPRPALTDFRNNRREELVPFVSKVDPSGPSRTSVHGPPPRPALTDFWNNRREELVPFVSKVHPSGPSRTSIHGPPPRPTLTDFWNNRRKEAVPSVSKVHPSGPSRTSVHGPPPRPAPTDFWNNRREELVPFVSKVHPSGPSRTSVHGPPPRSALTDFWNNRRKEAVPFVSKVHPSSPSRPAVHGPLSRPAMTDFWNIRRQKSTLSFFSKAHRSGPSRPSVHDPLSQPALTHIVKAIFIENCCFSKRIKPKIICNPDLIFGLAEHLVTMTLYTTIHFECATLTLHSNSGLSFYLALESTGVEWNIIGWSAKHTAPRKTWSNIIFLRLESF